MKKVTTTSNKKHKPGELIFSDEYGAYFSYRCVSIGNGLYSVYGRHIKLSDMSLKQKNDWAKNLAFNTMLDREFQKDPIKGSLLLKKLRKEFELKEFMRDNTL